MARLPKVGGDDGSWGQILNDYLAESHDDDGKLKAGSVGSSQLKSSSVTSTSIADGSITSAKIADGAVGGAQISDGAVQTTHIADGAVTAQQLADDVILAGPQGEPGPQGETLVTVNAQESDYTLGATDAGNAVEITSPSGTTVTVPSGVFPIGSIVEVAQIGSGQVTLVAGSGVTLQSADGLLKTRAQFSTISIRKRDTDTWLVVGDVA